MLSSDNVLHSCCNCQTDRQIIHTFVDRSKMVFRFSFSWFSWRSWDRFKFCLMNIIIISHFYAKDPLLVLVYCSCFAWGFPDLLDHYRVVSVPTNHWRHLIKELKPLHHTGNTCISTRSQVSVSSFLVFLKPLSYWMIIHDGRWGNDFQILGGVTECK